jgi:hypothetical protein
MLQEPRNGKNGNGENALASDDYSYDVFLSYSFKTDVQEWVNNKFYPNFSDPLDEELIQRGLHPPPSKGRVCLAKREIRPGDPWPDELQEQLLRSKVLVAICSPHYFVSRWCQAEWQTFQSRAPKLIIPLLYYGSDDYLLPRLQQIQAVDFRRFREIPGGRMARFKDEVTTLAMAVAEKVAAAPPFSGMAPSVILSVPTTPNVSFLSL